MIAIPARRAVLSKHSVSNIIGVEWNQGTDTWTRINENGDEVDAPDFTALSPWQDITRVNLAADGTVNARLGTAGFALDGSNGEVMVEIPKFWVKSTNPSANVYRWWIADGPVSGFEVHPAFFQGGGTERDHLYIGAYEAWGYDDSGTFKLGSKTGVQPVTGTPYTDLPGNHLDLGEARTYAQNIGSGWNLINVWSWAALQLLGMIFWGNMDSQTELGRGIVDKASGSGFAGENTGHDDIDNQLDSLGNGTGTGTDGLTPICLFYLENLWGNAWSFVDGFNAVDAEYRLINRDGSGTFADTLAGGDYEASVAAPITSDGYVDNIEYEDLLQYQLIAKSVSGSDSTYIPDYMWGHDAGKTNILRAGAHGHNGSQAGLGALDANAVASHSGRKLGARLEFIG